MITRSGVNLRAVAAAAFALLSCVRRVASAPIVEAPPSLIAVCAASPHVVAQVHPDRIVAVGGTSASIDQKIVAQARWSAVKEDGIRPVGSSLEAACAAEGSRASFLVSGPASLLAREELDARDSALVQAEAGADFSEAHLIGDRFVEVVRYPGPDRAAAIALLDREGRAIPGARLVIGDAGPDGSAVGFANGPWVSMGADAARAISVMYLTDCPRCSTGGAAGQAEASLIVLSVSGNHFEFVSPQRFSGAW